MKDHGQKVKGKVLTVRYILTQDMKWYYSLKGVKSAHGLMFIKDEGNFQKHDGWFYIVKPCKLLKGLMCEGHPRDKPQFCKSLTEETYKSGDFVLTPNCLFKYKDPMLAKLACMKESKELKDFFKSLREV